GSTEGSAGAGEDSSVFSTEDDSGVADAAAGCAGASARIAPNPESRTTAATTIAAIARNRFIRLASVFPRRTVLLPRRSVPSTAARAHRRDHDHHEHDEDPEVPVGDEDFIEERIRADEEAP